MSVVKLYEGDNRISLADIVDQGVRVHSVVTDPPYHLESIQKRFGKTGSAVAKFGTDGAFQRASAGFCGSKWDGADANGVRIAFDPAFWAKVYEVLLPGGFCLAFSSARTGHRQACAMEDAGFILHPMKAWLFGSGMPKAHSAARAIDKRLGVAGSLGGPKSEAHAGWIARGRMRGGDDADNHEAWQRPWMEDADKVEAAARTYLPGSPEGQQWDGWAYGSPMKPAFEPIYVAQKPISEKTFAANILKHGVGAVNVEGSRPSSGRHPANLLHDGSDDVLAMFPTANSARASGNPNNPKRGENHSATSYGQGDGTVTHDFRDSGSAARFFNSFPVDSDPCMYHPKASKADRAGSSHPTVKPVALMEWLIKLVTPPGGTILDPFAGSGTTGQAALNLGFDCILMEAEEQFVADIRRRFGIEEPDPIAAMFS